MSNHCYHHFVLNHNNISEVAVALANGHHLHHQVHDEGEVPLFPRSMANTDCLRWGSSWQSQKAKNGPFATNCLVNGLQSCHLGQSAPPH